MRNLSSEGEIKLNLQPVASNTPEFIPVLEKKVTAMDAISSLIHEKKRQILETLIPREMKVIELVKQLGINPGTIKRHIDEMIAQGLVTLPRIVINALNVKEKYYRATARRFVAVVEVGE